MVDHRFGDYLSVGDPLLDDERPGAAVRQFGHRVINAQPIESLLAADGQARVALEHVEEEQRVRTVDGELYNVRAYRFRRASNPCTDEDPRAVRVRSVPTVVARPYPVGGGHLTPIAMERDALSDLEGVRLQIAGQLPALRQTRDDESLGVLVERGLVGACPCLHLG